MELSCQRELLMELDRDEHRQMIRRSPFMVVRQDGTCPFRTPRRGDRDLATRQRAVLDRGEREARMAIEDFDRKCQNEFGSHRIPDRNGLERALRPTFSWCRRFVMKIQYELLNSCCPNDYVFRNPTINGDTSCRMETVCRTDVVNIFCLVLCVTAFGVDGLFRSGTISFKTECEKLEHRFRRMRGNERAGEEMWRCYLRPLLENFLATVPAEVAGNRGWNLERLKNKNLKEKYDHYRNKIAKHGIWSWKTMMKRMGRNEDGTLIRGTGIVPPGFLPIGEDCNKDCAGVEHMMLRVLELIFPDLHQVHPESRNAKAVTDRSTTARERRSRGVDLRLDQKLILLRKHSYLHPLGPGEDED